MFKPQHLTEQEVNQIYGQLLKELEGMQLRAQVTQRVHQAYGPGCWDPDTGEDLISAVRAEWHALQDEVPKDSGG